VALRWLCGGGDSSFGNLRKGLLRALSVLSYFGATLRFVGSVGRFLVVVGFRLRFCNGGVLSTACVFVGLLLGELRPDTGTVQLFSKSS
jgi:hypothetical protein